MGEEPAHFLNMMDGNFITLQVGIVVTRIIVAIVVVVTIIVVIIAAIIKIFFFSTNFSSHVCRGALRERSPLCRIRMASCSSSVGKIHNFMQCNAFMCTCVQYMYVCVHMYYILPIIIIIKFQPITYLPEGFNLSAILLVRRNPLSGQAKLTRG